MAMDLSAFFAGNAISIENVKYVASKRYIDPETKEPIPWELSAVESAVDEAIRKECTIKKPIPGKRGQYTNELDSDKYIGKLCARCTVFPNLNDVGLQDSYGVKDPDALLKKMLNVGEYTEFKAKVVEINGFDTTMEELVDEAKN